MERGDRFVTYQDLVEFKTELLSEIKKLNQQYVTKKWLKSKDVMKILGISAGKLQSMRDKNEIQFKKIGASIFYREEDVFRL